MLTGSGAVPSEPVIDSTRTLRARESDAVLCASLNLFYHHYRKSSHCVVVHDDNPFTVLQNAA